MRPTTTTYRFNYVSQNHIDSTIHTIHGREGYPTIPRFGTTKLSREWRLTVSGVAKDMQRNGEGSQPISVTGSRKMAVIDVERAEKQERGPTRPVAVPPPWAGLEAPRRDSGYSRPAPGAGLEEGRADGT
ncbi:hypothetical protein DPX16_17840 [Anabarilius grahami]|uniref:Uncharacterized protein n=1 Tax=Anabarilius grahami TaxID=495550 RepID=A0A3N0YEH9_ANAGA|nr:hypothetical protein DPX16_17840 [Anabarilius grahami]